MTFRETVCYYSPRLHRLSIREKCLEKQGSGIWQEEKNQEQKVFNFDDEAIRFQFFGIKEDSYDLGVNSGQVSWTEIQESLQHFTNFLSVMSGLYVSQMIEKDSLEPELKCIHEFAYDEDSQLFLATCSAGVKEMWYW